MPFNSNEIANDENNICTLTQSGYYSTNTSLSLSTIRLKEPDLVKQSDLNGLVRVLHLKIEGSFHRIKIETIESF